MPVPIRTAYIFLFAAAEIMAMQKHLRDGYNAADKAYQAKQRSGAGQMEPEEAGLSENQCWLLRHMGWMGKHIKHKGGLSAGVSIEI